MRRHLPQLPLYLSAVFAGKASLLLYGRLEQGMPKPYKKE